MDREELTDLISDALSDSFDVDWTASIGARYVVDALVKENIHPWRYEGEIRTLELQQQTDRQTIAIQAARIVELEAARAALEEKGVSEADKGWLPIALCPTDGIDRALLLPDGREVVGAFSSHSGWRTATLIERDQPEWEPELKGGFMPMPWEARPKRGDKIEPRPTGTRRVAMRLLVKLPEGIYPTHFRPNDTVYGTATPTRAAPDAEPEATPEQGIET